MDPMSNRQVNEAAEKFAEALAESHGSLADRSVSDQELNIQITQDFFNSVMANLRARAEENQEMTVGQDDQQHPQLESPRVLTHGAVDGYRDFLQSMFGEDPVGNEAGGEDPVGNQIELREQDSQRGQI